MTSDNGTPALQRAELGGGLVIYIENSRPLRVAELTDMLGGLDRAFREFARRRGHRSPDAGLAIVSVETGSIQIFLDAVDAAEKLWKLRQLVGPFAIHLAQAAQILMAGGSLPARSPDRKALAGISSPVTQSGATQINLVNNGVIHLHVDPQMASSLQEALGRTAPARTTHFEQLSAAQLVSPEQVKALESAGAEGTALQVDEDWYARLLGGQGVLVPIMASLEVRADLEHRRLYRFRGQVRRDHRGGVIGIEVVVAEPIG